MRFNHISELELSLLKSLYESKVSELKEQLGKGKPWRKTRKLRSTLLQLSALIYDKVQTTTEPFSRNFLLNHPAEERTEKAGAPT